MLGIPTDLDARVLGEQDETYMKQPYGYSVGNFLQYHRREKIRDPAPDEVVSVQSSDKFGRDLIEYR